MLAPDTILQNRYRIVRKLSEGGMGIVYEAVDERLDAIVALKECNFTNEKLRRQFEREARLLARLRHPSMPRVIDHFNEGDGQFLVMDFVVGDDLLETLKKRNRPFPVDEVLGWADQLLDGLDYLHRQDPPVIHRDIKPQNLKVTISRKVMLLDFGLAKGLAGQAAGDFTFGSVFGFTPHYASLEQIKGTGTDPRSDLYSLAATLYHLITGVVPPDVLTRVSATTDELPDPLLPANEVNPQVSPVVASVLSRAMTVGRTQRLATATEMRGLLQQANQGVAIETFSGPTLIAADVPSTVASPPQVLDTTELDDIPAATVGTDSQVPTLHQSKSSTHQPIVTVGQKDAPLETTPVMPIQTHVVTNRRPLRLLWVAVPACVILVIAVGLFLAIRPRTEIAGLSEQALPSPVQTASISSVQGGNLNTAQNIPTVDAPTTTPKPSATKSTPTPTPTPSNEPPKKGGTIIGPTNIDAPYTRQPSSPAPSAPLAGGVLNGKAIRLPAPAYPAIAKAAHAHGQVKVQVLIDEGGNVVSAHAISGHPLLQAVSVAAARGAKFTPTTLSGQPVKVSGVIIYNFVGPEP